MIVCLNNELFQSITCGPVWQWIGQSLNFFQLLDILIFYYYSNKKFTIKQNVFTFLYKNFELLYALYHINHFQTKNYLPGPLSNEANFIFQVKVISMFYCIAWDLVRINAYHIQFAVWSHLYTMSFMWKIISIATNGAYHTSCLSWSGRAILEIPYLLSYANEALRKHLFVFDNVSENTKQRRKTEFSQNYWQII